MSQGIITKLEIQKRNQERVNVFIDDVFAFGLNLVDAAKLRKGQQLSEAEIEALRNEDDIQKAVDRAIGYLSRRPRSVQEIRQYLRKKKIPDDIIPVAIDRLQTLRYLDDEAFTRFWVENRVQFNPRGSRALRYELRQKGIDNELIDKILAEKLDESASAYEAASKRIRQYRGLTQRDFRNKLGTFLQRRGFQYEFIREALDRLIQEIEAEDSDYFVDEYE